MKKQITLRKISVSFPLWVVPELGASSVLRVAATSTEAMVVIQLCWNLWPLVGQVNGSRSCLLLVVCSLTICWQLLG